MVIFGHKCTLVDNFKGFSLAKILAFTYICLNLPLKPYGKKPQTGNR